MEKEGKPKICSIRKSGVVMAVVHGEYTPKLGWSLESTKVGDQSMGVVPRMNQTGIKSDHGPFEIPSSPTPHKQKKKKKKKII
jgi:hypothetical protein